MTPMMEPAWAQSVQLPEIVIEAGRLSSREGDGKDDQGKLTVVEGTFVPVTVVSRDEVERNAGRTLGDQLQFQPGITTSGFAPGSASRPIIRGLDTYRVRIQENGVGVQDASDLGEDHAVPVDPMAIQQIEVIRGPASLRFGSGAIGGVVSAVNNRIPLPSTPEGVTGQTRLGVTSVDRGVEAGQSVTMRQGQFAVHYDGFARRTQDYQTPLGRQFNSFTNTHGFSLGGSYFFDNGFVGANVSRTKSLYGIPGLSSYVDRSRIDMEQTKLSLRGELRPEASVIEAIRFWAGGSLYSHDENGLQPFGGFGTNLTFRNKELETRTEVLFQPLATSLGELSIATGVQAGMQEVSATGEAALLAPSTTKSLAAYAFGTLSVTETTRLQLAGRVEHASIKGTAATFPGDYLGASGMPTEFGISKQFTPMSASFGILQDLPLDFVASATVTYAQRAPRINELASKGAHDAPGTFDIGNPNLTKEIGKTIEIGLRRAVGPLRFDASLYQTAFTGFIYKRLTGNSCVDTFATCVPGIIPGDLKQIVYGQQDATFRGFEVKAQYDVGELGAGQWGVEGQYDVVRARFANGMAVPRIPPQRLGGGVFWRSDNWFARTNYIRAFAQRTIAANETPTPGYNLLNAELTYRYKPESSWLREITFGLVGSNLLNVQMRNHVSFRKDEVLMPGRSVRAFLTANF
ncbi:TonB-dependent receptor [Beijerinckia sp. GAS462]|nr:TonB-dependent receptor [Beijerinckia sp. GAS462]